MLNTSALCIAGAVVGASLFTSSVSAQTIYYLGTLGGRSIGYAVNNNGQIAGQSSQGLGFPNRAILYSINPTGSVSMVDLGTLGGVGAQAFDINDTGQMTGVASSAFGATHAFRYSGTPGAGGAMIDLMGEPGAPESEGHAINNAGEVAVGFAPPGVATARFATVAGR